MNLIEKVSYNFIISSFARITGLVLALVSLGFITRAIGSEGYGQYALVLAFLGFFQILADFGLQTLMQKELGKNPAEEKKIVSSFFTLRFFLSLIFLIPAPLLGLLSSYSAPVKLGISFTWIGYLFFSQSQILLGVFQKHLLMNRWALAEILGRLIQLALFYFGYKAGFGLFWFLSVFIASSFVIFATSLFFARRRVPFVFLADWRGWRQILKEALPIAVSLLFVFIYFKIDTLMLGVMKGEKEVGIYNLAYKVLEIVIAFPAIFVSLMIPIFSKLLAKDAKEFKKLFQRMLYFLAGGAIIVFIFGWIASPFIIGILGGDDFVSAAEVLRLLLVSTIFIFLGTLLGQVIILLGAQGKAAWVYGFGAIFNIATNLIFIPKYSYFGAAGTTVATELLVTATLFIIVLFIINKPQPKL